LDFCSSEFGIRGREREGEREREGGRERESKK